MDDKRKNFIENYRLQLEEAKSTIAFLDNIFNEINDSILIIDPESYKIMTFNQSALEHLGLKEAELLGETCHQLFCKSATPCENPYKACTIREILKTTQNVLVEYEYISKNNKLVYFEISANPIRDKKGNTHQIAFLMRDTTKKKRAALREKNILEVDEITGLYNQSFFYKQLKTEVSRSRRHQRPLSLLLASIDNQNIFDKLSLLNRHEFLIQMGRVISNCTRSVDTIYRYSEHNFAILLPETSGNQAIVFAERLKKSHLSILSELKNQNKLSIFSNFTLSMGIVEYKSPDNAEIMVKKAEDALQKAQEKGDGIIYHLKA